MKSRPQAKTTSAKHCCSRLCASTSAPSSTWSPLGPSTSCPSSRVGKSVRRVFVASPGRIEARGGCRYRPPSRHRLNQSGLLTSMLLYYDHMYRKKPWLFMYRLLHILSCFDHFPVNKSDRPLDCHGKVNCVVSQLFSRTLTLGLLG